MEQPSKEYIKGFNSGYIIAQYEPELAQQLTQAPDKDNDFFKGFTSGTKEYERERSSKENRNVALGKDNKQIDYDKER